jgi:transposase InsO family protein
MSKEKKRELVTMFHEQEGYPVKRLCSLLQLSRSSYYYQPIKRQDAALKKAVEKISARLPAYGSRRVTQELRRDPYYTVVNRKRIQRLMREMGLLRTQKTHRKYTTDSKHGFRRYPNLVTDLEITEPDQVWVSDITYIRLHREFVYLAVIMDVFTRSIRGWNLSRWLDHSLTVEALKRALETHIPGIHHSDQGVQYAANNYVDLLRRNHIRISMAGRGAPYENPYAERLIRTIKEEEVDLSEYFDFADARSQIGYFVEEVYQKKRIHSSLGYLTPVEFEEDYWQVQVEQTSSLSIA